MSATPTRQLTVLFSRDDHDHSFESPEKHFNAQWRASTRSDISCSPTTSSTGTTGFSSPSYSSSCGRLISSSPPPSVSSSSDEFCSEKERSPIVISDSSEEVTAPSNESDLSPDVEHQAEAVSSGERLALCLARNKSIEDLRKAKEDLYKRIYTKYRNTTKRLHRDRLTSWSQSQSARNYPYLSQEDSAELTPGSNPGTGLLRKIRLRRRRKTFACSEKPEVQSFYDDDDSD